MVRSCKVFDTWFCVHCVCTVKTWTHFVEMILLLNFQMLHWSCWRVCLWGGRVPLSLTASDIDAHEIRCPLQMERFWMKVCCKLWSCVTMVFCVRLYVGFQLFAKALTMQLSFTLYFVTIPTLCEISSWVEWETCSIIMQFDVHTINIRIVSCYMFAISVLPWALSSAWTVVRSSTHSCGCYISSVNEAGFSPI